MVFSSTFFVLLLVRNITSEAIFHVILLKSFIWQSVFYCKCQYVGSAFSFKQLFHIHKSDIKTKKDCCGTARHFNSICCHPINPHGYLKGQVIEQVFCDASKDTESILWEHEKYWQCQLFTNTHGMNCISDLYSRSRKGCRKVAFMTTLYFNYLRTYTCCLARANQTSRFSYIYMNKLQNNKTLYSNLIMKQVLLLIDFGFSFACMFHLLFIYIFAFHLEVKEAL